MKIAEAFVELRVDGRRGQAEAQAAARGAAEAATKMFVQFFTAKVAIDQFVAFKNAASDLQQAIGGTEAQFGSYAATIDKVAESSAQAMGLSEATFRTLTTQIGGLLQGLGFTQDKAAEISTDLTQLGADLAATYGGTTREAVEALGAALRGEFDPLERYGASLRQSAINAKAVELGLASSTTKVDDNARAHAALALITENTANAQGQFAREAETTAGKEARLTAELENQRAEIGARLLPVYVQIIGMVAMLGEAFGALPPMVQTGIIVMLGVAAIAGPVNNVIQAFGGLKDAIKSMSTTAKTATVTMGLLGVALVAATVIYGNYERQKAKAKAITDEFVTALQAEANGQLDATNAMIAGRLASAEFQALLDALGLSASHAAGYIKGETVPSIDALRTALQTPEGFKGLQRVADDAGLSTGRVRALADELGLMQTQFGVATEYVAANKDVLDELDRTQGKATVSAGDLALKQEEASAAAGRLATEALRAKEGIDAEEEAARAAEEAAGDVAAILDRQIAKNREAADAAEAWRDRINSSFDDAAAAVGSFSEDSMSDLDAWQEELRQDAIAIFNWQANLVTIAGATSADFAAYLADMGLAGADLVDEMAKTPAELQESFDAWRVATAVAGKDMAAEFAKVAPEMRAGGVAIGRAGAEGVASGITANIFKATSAMFGLADKVVAAGKSRLIIQSPSRVMADEVGRPIAEGVALGIDEGADRVRNSLVDSIEDAQDDVVSAAERLVKAASDALSGALGTVNLRFGVEDAFEAVRDAQQRLERATADTNAGTGDAEDVSDAQTALERAYFRLANELLDQDPTGNRSKIREALGNAGLTGDEIADILEAAEAQRRAEEGLDRAIGSAESWGEQAAVLANAIVTALNAGDQGGVTIHLNALSGLDEAARQSLFREIDEYFRRKAGQG